ncbi:GNAT family N-acetyltransferase [Dyadobacter chenwenxiniae]|uniref:GNAT family N-acetyltransferase n=1 Tax=Dyadobacter chenwenxiniae TaxID=2906456 RepID=A0A9X1PJR8_9BACT|nr:GNAT family N-acetyltransferase [Dyadobacter chenwenxiniae]MCF0061259.1 GNAT family N-acetyltransferase [Dyadobacter chenwenxiniae]UON81081.1 GNAT family N-acetyltransferase [Dyadobacter chenwenxiniae]
MKVKTISTENFVLTKMTAADGDKYFRLSNNDNVMKFVTGHALDRQESDKMLQTFLTEYGNDTFLGRYLIEGRSSGELIGTAKLDMDGSGVEIGYRIMEEHWGKGIATEIARGLISFARQTLNAKQVIAYVNVDNAASIRVLEKAGMVNAERIEDPDEVKFKFIFSPQKSVVKKTLGPLLMLIRKLYAVKKN